MWPHPVFICPQKLPHARGSGEFLFSDALQLVAPHPYFVLIKMIGSARERWRASPVSTRQNQHASKSRLGRLTSSLLAFFRRSKALVKPPASFFRLPTSALIFKQGLDRTFQTSQAAEIEVAEQRRLMAEKDRELESSRRELEDAQGSGAHTSLYFDFQGFVFAASC